MAPIIADIIEGDDIDKQANDVETISEMTKSTSPSLLARDPVLEACKENSIHNCSVLYDVEHLATFSLRPNIQTAASGSNENGSDDIGRLKVNHLQPQLGQKYNVKGKSHIESSVENPRAALNRLFELEKLSGIWTQHMQIELKDASLRIIDCESNSTVEKFYQDSITKPEAFNRFNDIYNNILVFIVEYKVDVEKAPKLSSSDTVESERSGKNSEIYIFQCVSHEAQQVVEAIEAWRKSKPMDGQVKNDTEESSKTSPTDQEKSNGKTKSDSRDAKSSRKSNNPANMNASSSKPVITVASKADVSDTKSIVNVNVKETVQVFNQIAALREISKSGSPSSQTRLTTDSTAPNLTNGSGQSSGSEQKPELQLYKQRSIRASLGPSSLKNVSTNREDPTKESNAQPEAVSSNSESAASTSTVPSLEAKSMGSKDRLSSRNDHSSTDRQLEHQQTTVNEIDTTGQFHQHHHQHQHQQQHQHQHQHHHNNRKTRDLSADDGISSSVRHQMHQQKSSSRSQQRSSQSDLSRSQVSSSSPEQVSSNESYVSVLNHCFDDIEKFIMRLQQATAAAHGKRKSSSRTSTDHYEGGVSSSRLQNTGFPLGAPSHMSGQELAMLKARQRAPSEDDYFEIFSKFKLAYNLLAKLRGCIHDPNAPELVHFLFTPLVIIIESARNAPVPVDPTLVGIPFLSQDAIDLLSNCCSSKEFDLWMSLGPNWTRTVDPSLLEISRLPTSFQPVFFDGWAPVIGELELIGLVAPSDNPMGDGSNPSDLGENPVSCQSGTSSQRASKSYLLSRNHRKKNASAPSLALHPDAIASSYGQFENINPQHTSYMYAAPDISMNRSSHYRSTNIDPILNYGKFDGRNLRHSGLQYQATDYECHRFSPADDDGGDLEGGELIESARYKQDSYGSVTRETFVSHHPGRYQMTNQGPISHYTRADQMMVSPRYLQRRHHMQQSVVDKQQQSMSTSEGRGFQDELDHEAILNDLGPAQMEWFFELKSRRAMIVRVLFTREANNEKELSVQRGELLEILDHSRRWWRARNIDLEVAFVPHTIVAVMNGYQTLDELLAGNPYDMSPTDCRDSYEVRGNQMGSRDRVSGGPSRHEIMEHPDRWFHRREAQVKTNTGAGPFRYF